MTAKKDLKRLVRQRQLKTGESYTTAFSNIRRERSPEGLGKRTEGRPLVLTGLDAWALRGFEPLKGLRVGLVCNASAVDAQLRHAADLLHAAPGVDLACLFAPEHGVRGDAPYMTEVDDEQDRRTGCPVYSLYGRGRESLRPRVAQLSGLDALVFDMQDVGSRHYTYQATLMLCLEAAAEARLKFIVLDRPNPIGGTAIEGPGVQPGFESFCGLHDLPVRHGMTIGELARLYRTERKLAVDLEVVPCEGWKRAMHFSDTGLTWVSPSPNMPTPDTALVYPGMCLLEGTNLSEGRGTSKPFEVFGAPWLDAEQLAAALEAERLPGVRFRPTAFQPGSDKHAGTRCQGVALHVTDRRALRPFLTGLACVVHARAAAPGRFAWRTEQYEFEESIPAFDLLTGSRRERAAIEQGSPVGLMAAGYGLEEERFAKRRAGFLLYS
jgi:uncharacterized protein YbbC (DUF1343 family)